MSVDRIIRHARSFTRLRRSDLEGHSIPHDPAEESFVDLERAVRDYFTGPPGTCSTCRSCSAPIFWIETKNGRRMPLDHSPIQAVNAEGEVIRVHLSHFATCPQGAEWSRKAREEEPEPQPCGAQVRRSGLSVGPCARPADHEGSCQTGPELARSS